MNSEQELYHYGVKGMKWGIRRDRKSNPVKQKTKEYRTSRSTDPKTDFLKINRPNSAARNYYKAQRSGSLRTYKQQNRLMDRKISGLTKEQIENGRYRVARARNIKRKIASGVITTGATIATFGTGLPLAAVAVAPAVAVGSNFLTGGFYYSGESATYGKRRAERELKKKS